MTGCFAPRKGAPPYSSLSHLVLEASHAALEQQVGDLAAEVCQEHLLEHPQQHLGHALGQLEDDIAGKAVADHHVHLTVGHITRLDIAHKADARGWS